MKIKLFLILLLFPFISRAQNIRIIHTAELLQLFKPDSEGCLVNFWSTWCKPCVHEMPLFVKADSIYSKSVKFIFVSFDRAEDSAKVRQMAQKLQIPGDLYLIDETDMNKLINDVDTGWSGALPATWFIGPLYRKPWFLNFTQFNDLKTEIDLLIAAHE